MTHSLYILDDSPWFEWIRLHSTDSTIDFLKHYRPVSPKDMILVTADFQTAGRGQAGNSWESEAGKNLLFGLLFHPREVEANRQFILSQAVALSICETLSDYAEDIRIKWPNDIYWKDRKICGMLIENTLVGRCIENCIIGAGININQQTFCSDAPNPVSLRQITGKEQEPVFILADTMTNASRTIIGKSNKAKRRTSSVTIGNGFTGTTVFIFTKTRTAFSKLKSTTWNPPGIWSWQTGTALHEDMPSRK